MRPINEFNIGDLIVRSTGEIALVTGIKIENPENVKDKENQYLIFYISKATPNILSKKLAWCWMDVIHMHYHLADEQRLQRALEIRF